MSYNPMTGLAYIPVLQISAIYNDEGIDPDSWQSAVFEGDTTAVGWRIVEDRTHLAGSLQARDPVTNTVAWEVPMYGIGNAGTMTTAGNLVFQGRVDGTLRAYDATTGEELWSHDLGLGITAPPVTYSVRVSFSTCSRSIVDFTTSPIDTIPNSAPSSSTTGR